MGHLSLRKGRCSLEGQVYLVTFIAWRRRRHFSDFEIARIASGAIVRAFEARPARLLAWVLMPDHWHGIVELGGGGTLSTCIGAAKGRSSRRLRQAFPGIGRVWAPAFHDHALRAEEDLRAAARYVVANPLRAGLVGRIGDYPFWDAVWLQERL